MNDAQTHKTQPIIWLLLDDRVGNRSQCYGVAAALSLPFIEKNITYSKFAGLPNAILGASFLGLDQQSTESMVEPWPDIVIAAGRRTAGCARAIKRKSNGKTKLVQIMYPGPSGLSDFDLVVIPYHDVKRHGENFLHIIGAPHAITGQVLEDEAKHWQDKLSVHTVPRIAVFVGGSTRRKTFTNEMASSLGKQVNDLAKSCSGSLLISTSRRTGQASAAFMAEITVANMAYLWGDEGKNPYKGYLAMADAIVVSGDSVSMCSEACGTTAQVFIYAPDGFVIEKHARLHNRLYELGRAEPLLPSSKLNSVDNRSPLNDAETIALEIQKRFELQSPC